MRRRLLQVPVFSLGVLGLIACGSGPVDPTGSSNQALIEPIGSNPGNTVHEPPPPPVCTFETPANPLPDEYITAWATAPGASGCPQIPGINGLWAEIDSIPEPAGAAPLPAYPYTGVPGQFEPAGAGSPSCTSVAGMPADCCTYVWWPAGWATDPQEQNPAQQDSNALCQENGETFVALTYTDCRWETINGRETLPVCGRPAGGGCASCASLQ